MWVKWVSPDFSGPVRRMRSSLDSDAVTIAYNEFMSGYWLAHRCDPDRGDVRPVYAKTKRVCVAEGYPSDPRVTFKI